MRIAHSTKSVSASLGAEHLADTARQLENRLKDGQEPGNCWTDLRQRYPTSSTAWPACHSRPATALPEQSGSQAALFALLETDLSMANAASEAHFEHLRQVILSGPGNDSHEKILADIGALIADVEYEAALENCRNPAPPMETRQA